MRRLLMLVALAFLLASVFVVPAQPAEAREVWCTAGLDARDLGGGSLWNKNYVVELRRPFYPGDDARIYYNGQRQYLQYHGYFDGVNRWGVSTKWAYQNWSWQDDWRWKIEFRCQEA